MSRRLKYPKDLRNDPGGEENDWVVTFTGRWIRPLDPNPDDINIEDIAHSLANQCRFTGHVRKFYSTAQHSVLCSYIVLKEYQLWALLHDASEAYLSDIARPVKRSSRLTEFGDVYRAAEARLQKAICEHFGLPLEEPEAVKTADKMLLRAEQRDLMPNDPSEGEIYRPEIVPWTPEEAEEHFLMRFAHLNGAASYGVLNANKSISYRSLS